MGDRGVPQLLCASGMLCAVAGNNRDKWEMKTVLGTANLVRRKLSAVSGNESGLAGYENAELGKRDFWFGRVAASSAGKTAAR